jgi:hypothetical protein
MQGYPNMIPNLLDIVDLFRDEAKCIDFLQSHNIFYKQTACAECGGNLSLMGKKLRCTTKACHKSISLLRNSFFAQSRLDCNQMLYVGYLWLAGNTHASITTMTGYSNTTITNFMQYYRQLIASTLEADDMQIGGPGLVVEIDESKFGKRKYNRGHHVDGVWVLGGVERSQQRKMFVEIVANRSEATLVEVLSRRILPGTIIYSDMWKGYMNISELLNVRHEVVNHSLHYKDPATGIHTNMVEGTWNGLKLKIPI